MRNKKTWGGKRIPRPGKRLGPKPITLMPGERRRAVWVIATESDLEIITQLDPRERTRRLLVIQL